MTTSRPGDGATRPIPELKVVRTADRTDQYDYLVQLNESVAAKLGVGEGDLTLVSHDGPKLETQIQARLQIRDGLANDQVGIDFTLRYALGVVSADDIEYGPGDEPDWVIVSQAVNQEEKWVRRLSNRILGVRPEVCRTRMAVHPDLENRVCRLSGNTMDLIGIEEGDRVVIESSEGIVRGRKAFEIDDESRRRKEFQQKNDPERYVDCYDLLELDRIRETDVDIPEIYLDYDTRRELGISDKNNEGACHPVRVYRDSYYQFLRLSDGILGAALVAIVGASVSIGGRVGISLSVASGFLVILVLIRRSQRMLR